MMSENALTLICEDDWATGLTLAREIRASGIPAIGPVISSEEALLLAESEDIAIAVIDIELRDGRTGPAVARELHGRGAAVVICSGEGRMPPELSDLPPRLLTKPVEPEELKRTIRSALEERQGQAVNPANGNGEGRRGRMSR